MKIVRDLFLRCMSSVYLFAFASLYVQIPGQFTRTSVRLFDLWTFRTLPVWPWMFRPQSQGPWK